MVFLFAVWIGYRCAAVSSYGCCDLCFRLLCGSYAVVLLFQTVICVSYVFVVWIICGCTVFFSGCDLCFCSQSGLYATVQLAVWIVLCR